MLLFCCLSALLELGIGVAQRLPAEAADGDEDGDELEMSFYILNIKIFLFVLLNILLLNL